MHIASLLAILRKAHSMPKILLLEDDIGLIDGLEYSLHKNGFTVETVRTVGEALGRLRLSGTDDADILSPHRPAGECYSDDQTSSCSRINCISQYNLLLLDITLPDGTGFHVCEQVRRQNSRIPIIFLTASDEEVNIIRGLDSGGDDYITKPFRIGELCARIHALLRRAQPQPAYAPPDIPSDTTSHIPPTVSGKLAIDSMAGRVTLDSKPIELTRAEYRLLCLLVRNTGKVVTRDAILNELWDNAGDFVDDNTLSVYIRRLREKVEDEPSQPKRLITIRGFGYQWTVPSANKTL